LGATRTPSDRPQLVIAVCESNKNCVGTAVRDLNGVRAPARFCRDSPKLLICYWNCTPRLRIL
jgi:hypothetical protein